MKFLITAIILFSFLNSKGQNVIYKISTHACECINKLPYDSTSVIPADSINRCITKGIMDNYEEIKQDKKIKIGTVEGIIKVKEKVTLNLRKDCPKFKSAVNNIESK